MRDDESRSVTVPFEKMSCDEHPRAVVEVLLQVGGVLREDRVVLLRRVQALHAQPEARLLAEVRLDLGQREQPVDLTLEDGRLEQRSVLGLLPQLVVGNRVEDGERERGRDLVGRQRDLPGRARGRVRARFGK